MFQYIKAKVLSIKLVRRILKLKDEVRKVGDVMAAFHNTVNELEAVAFQHTSHAAAHAREIEARVAAKLEAEAEAIRATSIANKMKGIFA